MIPEPFTYAIAGFGVTLTLIGAAASVLESSKQRIDTFRDYQTRLKRLEDEVRLSELKFEDCLKGWRDDTSGELIPLENCAELFGTQHSEDIGRSLSLVITALAKLQQIVFLGLECTDSPHASASLQAELQVKAGPAYENAWNWMDGVNQGQVRAATSNRKEWKRDVRQLLSRRFSFLVRVKYTVWDGETIQKRAEALRKAIDNFRELTNILSNNLPKVPKAAENDEADDHESTLATRIMRLLQLDRRWKSFQSVMRVISGTSCAVLPRQPDDKGHTDWLSKGSDVITSILVEKTSDDGLSTREIVYVSYEAAMGVPHGELVNTTLTGQCKGDSSSLGLACPRFQGKVLRTLYESVARQPISIRQKLQRLWELERVEIALSLINWTLLLWATPWSLCVCTSRLRRYPVVGGGARISMMPCAAHCHQDTCRFEALITSSRAWPRTSLPIRKYYFRPTPTHQEVSKARRTLISLAITLCEMALLMPVELRDPDERPLVFHCDEEQELTTKLLLDRVERVMTAPYRAAVQKCLDYATASVCTLTAAADLIAFSDKLLMPLVRWKASVVDVRNKTQLSRRYYLQLPEETATAVQM